MAKPLVVEFQGKTLDLTLEKVDRARLYGFVDTEVCDEVGKRCELATLAGDGHTIVGKGGSGLAYLSHDGLWRTKAELKPVDPQGRPIVPVKSTFDATVVLDRTVSIDEYLSHNIHLIYLLTPNGDHAALLTELQGGAIYQFPFSYRGGVEASAGFLLLGSDGRLFLCVGTPTAYEFVGLQASAAVVPDPAETVPDDEDPLDFSLV